MATKFESALAITREEHNQAFERFANAFLVNDYPELQALGGKHDGAIDARLISDKTGKLILVVQSCVSPKERARTKILTTIALLEKRGTLAPVFVYCTSATIGDSLDDLKRDLRTSKNLTLEVHDAAWLSQRELTKGRGELCARYASFVLAPISQNVNRDVLYSSILSEEKQRLAFQYLEAQRLDNLSGGNITKRTFSALVLFVLKENAAPNSALASEDIVQAICALFHDTHHQRIQEIVVGRLQHLENNKTIHFNKQLNGYVLSADKANALRKHLDEAHDLDTRFRVSFLRQIDDTCNEREIDYDFDRAWLAGVGHSCVLWHMKRQADRFIDPFRSMADVIFADKLLTQYLADFPVSQSTQASRDALRDVLPHALYSVINSRDMDVQRYLRSKSDLLILQAFLQLTPDVYEACRGLIGQDIIYLDASALIRCLAELYSSDGEGPLTIALRHARTLNTQLRVLRPHIDELVSHIRGPVLLEWENHFSSLSQTEMEPRLWTAPTLIKVFAAESIRRGRPFRSLVEEVIGQGNEWENTKEFLIEELNVTVEDGQAPEDNEWWQRLFGVWLDNKRRTRTLTDARFEMLVRNDVNAFTTIVQMRNQLRIEGDNYGYKVWLLTFDSMYWRMPSLLNQSGDHSLHIGMSMDYLIQYVSTAAQAGMLELPDGILPATLLLDEAETSSMEFRDVVVDKWNQPGEKKYMRERRLRDLLHDLKAQKPQSAFEEGLGSEADLQEPL